MMGLSFASPWLLAFLGVLPVIWLLLRLTPPAPKKITFPALELLRGLTNTQQTPQQTPWWLLLLRLSIAALVIIALAEPSARPQSTSLDHGTTLVLIDNDWAAARNWDKRMEALHNLVSKAERDNQDIMLLSLAANNLGDPLRLEGAMNAKAAIEEIKSIHPQPWPSDWNAAKNLVEQMPSGSANSIYWLSSGVGNAYARALFDTLSKTAPTRVLVDKDSPIYTLQPPQIDASANSNGIGDGSQLVLPVFRAETDTDTILSVAGYGRDGQVLTNLPVHFITGAPRATANFDVPVDIRNHIVRFAIEGQHSAATTVVLDASWEQKSVGLMGDKAELDQHSLLSSLFYIDRALKPFADVRISNLDELLKIKPAVIIVPDGELSVEQAKQISAWVKNGGTLIRFANDHMATSGTDNEEQVQELLPVTLISGDRALGGALSWAAPQTLQVFAANSPFHGLAVPADVKINRQLLAEPAPDLAAHTWASLSDGTPLVTAKNWGRGTSVLFHVPARSDWSNLPLSGLFVDMLRRIVDLSHTAHDTSASRLGSLPPLHVLDGFGETIAPSPVVQSLNADDITHVSINPLHPPGLYGTDSLNRAINLGSFVGQPEALRNIPTEDYPKAEAQSAFKPYLLLWAFLLLVLDFILSLVLRGLLRWPQKIALGIVLVFVSIPTLHASPTSDKNPIELTSKTILAYVETGDSQLDNIALSGLSGLARILQRRTSIDDIGVTGIDPNRDELAFYPFIYWPVSANQQRLSNEGAQRINDYLHHGGMIVFDTMTGETPIPGLMQRITAGLDIPPLVKLPQDHVLKRSFYLLDDFPGRYAGTDFWLQPEDASAYDGVATVLLGSNGWAAAWAVDDNGKPLFPCSPGGEQQRERAWRFGINLAMYALTGNYKSDQLHTQELLKRMGK